MRAATVARTVILGEYQSDFGYTASVIRAVFCRRWRSAWALGLLTLTCLCGLVGAAKGQTAPERTRVTVQLNWKHQFEFAAFYAAKAQGFYAAAGLDVEVKQASVGTQVTNEVIAHRAHFGVGNSSLLLDRVQGEPVVVLAALMQQSPIALMARRDKGLRSVKDLAGKTVMVPPHAFDEIRAFVSASGLDPNDLRYVPMSSTDVKERLRTADATEIYTTNEGFLARSEPNEYLIWPTRSAGLEFYGNVLFTSQYLIKTAPDLVHKFRNATLEGLRYAMQYPEEVSDLILSLYNTQGKSREHLLFEAQEIKAGNLGHFVDDGYMSENRWTLIAKTYQNLGLTPDAVVPADFIYVGDVAGYKFENLIKILVLALVGTVLILAVAAYIVLLNRRLQRSVSELSHANAALAHMALHDPLTKTANRTLFEQHLQKSLELAKRNHSQLALLLVDVDKFKQINDTHGHAVGDLVLKAVADRLRDHVRHADIVARLGGDEFVVLLPEVANEQGALQLAKHLREQVYLPIVDGVRVFRVTLSIGVALYPQHGADATALMQAADLAMYKVKSGQLGQVSLARSPAARPAGFAAGAPRPPESAADSPVVS